MTRRHVLTLAAFLLCNALALQGCGGGTGSTDGGTAPLPVGTGTLSLLTGTIGGTGNLDGAGTAARFRGPYGLALDAVGNLYVGDAYNALIRKITPDGLVSTVAGTGAEGFADGPAAAATFCLPTELATDAKGNVFVAGPFSPIRRISLGGLVSTISGRTTYPCSSTNAVHDIPTGPPQSIAADPFGNLYVANTQKPAIYKIDVTGSVTLFATGSDTTPTGSSALGYPQDLATDAQGKVYASVTLARGGETVIAIQKITPSGFVSTVADLSAFMRHAPSFALDESGNIYLADTGNQVIRKLTPAGALTVLAGAVGESGTRDGPADVARFASPSAIAVNSDGSSVYVSDGLDTIRRIDSTSNVTTFAGLSAPTAPGFGPYHATDRSGNVFFTVRNSQNPEDHALQRVAPDGTVTTLVATGLQHPSGIAVDGSGSVYIADAAGYMGLTAGCTDCGTPATILEISPQGRITALAGGYGFDEGRHDDVNGVGSAAVLRSPVGLTLGSNGNLYLAQGIGSPLRKITPDGVVITPSVSLAGGRLYPHGIAADQTGNLFVTTCTYAYAGAGLPASAAVVKIGPSGTATVLAGSLTEAGYVDGLGAQARFNGRPIDDACLQGIAVDAAGNVFVADSGNDAVRKISMAGQVSTVAGQAGRRGITLGALPGTLSTPTDVSLGDTGVLYVGSAQAILRIRLSE